MKNKKGFTLIEMILTIALIVVLTTVFTASLTTYITKSRAAAGQVEEHVNKYDAAKAAVMALRGNGGAAVPVVVPVNFLVTFADWDGTVLNTPQSVTSGSAATAPADPARAGHIFSGWSPSAFSNITAVMTVTAQYSIKSYKVTFRNWDLATLKEEMVNYGGSATAPTSPTRAGYVFIGWSPSVYTNVTQSLTITAQYGSPITGVSISGTPQFNSTLTASVAPSGATVSYQWSRASTAGGTYSAISGATAKTYKLVLADVAQYIKVTVVGTGTYTGTATSGSVGPVATIPLTSVTASGKLKKDNTQTATVAPSAATVTYQWQLATSATGTYTDIPGATAKTYKLPNNSNNAGKYIRVIATGTGGYAGSTVTSTGRGPIA